MIACPDHACRKRLTAHSFLPLPIALLRKEFDATVAAKSCQETGATQDFR
jgi:hypothetical protein